MSDQQEPEFIPGEYVVTFTRIGRARPGPLTTYAATGLALAGLILDYAGPYLRSADVEVNVRWRDGTGSIICGAQSGGTFTWARQIPVTAVSEEEQTCDS